MAPRCLCAGLLFCAGGRWAVAGSCLPPGTGEVQGPFVPRRQDVGVERGWREALHILLRDGAVVLEGLLEGTDVVDFKALAGDLPRRLFAAGGGDGGDGGAAGGSVPAIDLLSPDAPVNGVHEELQEKEKRGFYKVGSGLEPHTDGYVYGDHMPDFVFLLCEQTSPGGGANVLLDGHGLVEGLDEGSAADRALSKWLRSADVDLTETSDTGLVVGRNATGPIVQWPRARSGARRLRLRRQVSVREAPRLASFEPLAAPGLEGFAARRCAQLESLRYLSTWRPLASGAEEDQSRLERFDALLQQVSAEAFAHHRFALARGEALVVDNYRVLHGRTPYVPDAGAAEERRLWRVWSWTSEGAGLPPDGARSSNPLNEEVFQSQPAAARTDL